MDKKTPKLQVCNLNKYYLNKCVLSDISFTVAEGEFLSILGPSGCGKTTILRILAGLLKPDSGTVLKDGEDITTLSPSKRGMGVVFQNFALFENMTVLGNVEYALKIHKETKEGAREKSIEILKKMGLEEHINKKPAALSNGQQQRVAIARTLVLNPSVILFDEPTSALDIATRLSLCEEIKKIQTEFKTTIIYITHDQEEAFNLSDKIMVMKEAVIEQLDTPENIISSPKNDYVKQFIVDNLQTKANSLSRFLRR